MLDPENVAGRDSWELLLRLRLREYLRSACLVGLVVAASRVFDNDLGMGIWRLVGIGDFDGFEALVEGFVVDVGGDLHDPADILILEDGALREGWLCVVGSRLGEVGGLLLELGVLPVVVMGAHVGFIRCNYFNAPYSCHS